MYAATFAVVEWLTAIRRPAAQVRPKRIVRIRHSRIPKLKTKVFEILVSEFDFNTLLLNG
jgi:hypothetical protein